MIPEKIRGIMQRLLDNKYEAYIVGGAVRDMLLGSEPNDWDIFTNATGEQILKIFPQGKIIGDEERQSKILTVIVDNVEVSQYRSSGDRTVTKANTTLKQHCLTCDFTINSLAMDINGKIYDYCNGQRDLKNKELRFVGLAMERVNEDPLRILRGIRFLSKYFLFDYMDLTMDIVETKLKELPKERVQEELMKILQYERGMYILNNYKLIDLFFPEYTKCRDMKGGESHNETVDQHMINSFNESCKITDDVRLRLACFLHDIGKGVIQSFAKKQTHFYQHEKVGAELMEKRLTSLKFSKEDIKYITTLIHNHMWIHDTKNISKRSYVKMFNRLDNARIPISDFLALNYCDNQGNGNKERVKFLEFLKSHRVYEKYYELKYSEEPMTIRDLKVKGQDVMDILKIKPGKFIGEKLQSMFELVMDGELKNERAELLNYIRGERKWNH